MSQPDGFQHLQKIIHELTDHHADIYPYIPLYGRQLPEIQPLTSIMENIRAIMFPGYFGSSLVNITSLPYHTGVNVEKLHDILSDQIYKALAFNNNSLGVCEAKEKASGLSLQFIRQLPKIKHLLSTDVKAVFDVDPSAKDYVEIIFSYPSIWALVHHRVAHELLKLDIPIIPRILSEMAHTRTGIDIHPGASIGEYFSIDHGTGVVIGQTAVIGKHVTLYQGVTLGAKSFTLDEDGNPVDVPRHPILEDYVTVYSNASILGRITIGEGSVIGGNVWLTESVPAHSKIVQSKVFELSVMEVKNK